MIEMGVVRDGERVELLGGEIVQMAAMGLKYVTCSEPEPDIAVVRERADRYETGHPGPADVLLVIEVSRGSLAHDRDVKVPRYAADGTPEAWLFDISRGRALVFREPSDGRYTTVSTVGRGVLSHRWPFST
ncbi:MAG: Uma2 family endonuclease [Dehalococcoidia bacterium]